METAELTYNQIRWLVEHGDRPAKHVQRDHKGFFVLMFDPKSTNGMEKVYLPKAIRW